MVKELKKNEKGFTLVELVVVIAILAVLVTLLVPRVMGNVADAKKSKEIGNARTIASEINVFNAKEEDPATRLSAGGDKIYQYDEIKNKLPLPTGVTWPSSSYAIIKVDELGNAYVDIVVTPIPTP